MENRARGEVPLKSEAGEYTLRFTVNAFCELEGLLAMSTNDVMEKMRGKTGPSVTLVRALTWAGLQSRHPDISVEQAGDIVHEIGIVATMAAVTEALIAGQPSARKKKATVPAV